MISQGQKQAAFDRLTINVSQLNWGNSCFWLLINSLLTQVDFRSLQHKMVAKAWLFLSFLVNIYSQLEELERNMSIYEGGEEYLYISHRKKKRYIFC
jgi:hypothetical protein